MLKVKKSKPILICAISLALCAMGSLTAVAVNHIGNDQNQSATVTRSASVEHSPFSSASFRSYVPNIMSPSSSTS